MVMAICHIALESNHEGCTSGFLPSSRSNSVLQPPLLDLETLSVCLVARRRGIGQIQPIFEGWNHPY